MLATLLAVAVILGGGGAAAAADPPYQWLRLDRHLVKWGSPHAGSGTEVTYAYVTAPRHSPDARNCRDLVPLDDLLQRAAVSRSALEREAEAAFAMWAAVADIRFRRVEDETAAQILIGAQATPRGVAFADVAYSREEAAPGREAGIRSIRRSLICLNPERPWKVGFGGDVAVYDLRYAIAHEAGHAIGLDHPGPSGQLMSFRYDELFRELQPGDIAGAVALYGRRSPAIAAATPVAVAAADACPAGAEDPSLTTALAPRLVQCPAAPPVATIADSRQPGSRPPISERPLSVY